MVETIGRTTGNSVAFQYSAPRILARDFDGIRMDITYKDIELQTSLAKSLGVPVFMVPVAQQIYQMAKAMGLRQGRHRHRAGLRAVDGRTGHPSEMTTSSIDCEGGSTSPLDRL
jgi:3-hydroxyisobutyrate dehydrogenase-like beta-hydroxyacid dehydrogenase